MTDEIWWQREIITPELKELGDRLCAAKGTPRGAFGTKGNEKHDSGGHRSQEWLTNSAFCDDRWYTRENGLSEDQARHIAAWDFTPGSWGTRANRLHVAALTVLLLTAAQDGQLDGLVEIQGTLNAETTFGINLLTGKTSSPDLSHLDHIHARYSRKRMRDRELMSKTLAVLTGETMDMIIRQGDPVNHLARYAQRLLQKIIMLEPSYSSRLGEHPIVVDGDYRGRTAYWVSVILTGGLGNVITGDQFADLEQILRGYEMKATIATIPAGPQGRDGIKGDKGDAAVLSPGATLRIVAAEEI